MPEPRPGLRSVLTRDLAAMLLATTGAFAGFFLLLSVVPLYAVEGGAASSGAGAVTGALMLSTVATQLAVPWLLGRLGYRITLALGLLFLGLPTLALVWASGLPEILLVTLLRGVGFGILTVVGGALIAELVPPERRGLGIGLYGLAVGAPNVLALPLGVWLAGNVGFGPVFVAGTAAPLLGLPALLVLSVPPPPANGEGLGVLAGLLDGRLARPLFVLCGVTLAAGVVVTFLPLAAGGGAASAALLAQGGATMITRWLGGVLGDRYGARHLLAPGVLAAGAGVVAPVWAENTALLISGMLLFGAGLGVLQNATLVLMFERAGPQGYGSASALWNVAFDAGTGLGAVVFGVVVQYAGFGPAFTLTAALVLSTLVLVRLDRRTGKKTS